MKKTIQLLLLCTTLCLLFACNEADKPDVITSKGDILISAMVPSPDGRSGSAYMQLIPNMDEANYDNQNAVPTTYSIPPVVRGKNIFDVPGASNISNTIKRYQVENGHLQLKGSLVAPENSAPTSLVTKGNKAYIALSGTAQILVADLESMTTLNTIDISEYGIHDKNPDPAGMLIRDHYLFVTLQQREGGFLPDVNRPAVDVLIIDLKTEKPLKMITDMSSGMTFPGSATDQNSIFMDEHQDIYINCYGSMGMFKSGLLRIKKGEMDFDKDYHFVLSESNIEGDSHKLNYLTSIVYYKNGKAYGVANVPAYFKDPKMPDYFKDRFSLPVEMDLRAQTIKTIGLPKSNGYGVVASRYNDMIVFGLSTDEANGFYTYDPQNAMPSSKAVITIQGYPDHFFQIQ